ncbi:ferritin-like domain-containing protein [Conexibacter sp. JD483]|uniref:ferritin-like domain-containing protein n=1 Tax=unclassified Conexibacter TaxID=2627773 RepID=UPI00271C95F5|nr:MULTISPECIES: ferritin-like domain-containing protein [unclassified Conexibacter]MDO8188060.1 ferritin-like domain-containing protein [Conexibacter sp. CPCC 205706]MDO8200482.1 ferritin-like domain-containing protein [Conexibacter sp. CPCC 205762]MDR9369829.1 ferritin-like domain-containing protein [Conexibacter sp. JD483]
MDARLSRRALLAGASGGAALALVGTGAVGGVGIARAQAGSDAEILTRALTLEQVVIASYGAALRDGPGEPRLHTLLRRLRRQEREHADVLASELDTLGVRAPAVPGDDAALARARAAQGLRHPLDQIVTASDVARFAVELENAQITLYLEAVRELGAPRLLTLAAQIMAAEGQHATVLRGLLSELPEIVVPSPFETGDAAIP